MNGPQVIIRQTFYHGCYAMIGEDLYPNPDFWISALYKRLVSTKASHFSPSHSTVNGFKAKQGQKYQTKHYSTLSIGDWVLCNRGLDRNNSYLRFFFNFKKRKLYIFQLHFMQLFSADTKIFKKKIKIFFAPKNIGNDVRVKCLVKWRRHVSFFFTSHSGPSEPGR